MSTILRTKEMAYRTISMNPMLYFLILHIFTLTLVETATLPLNPSSLPLPQRTTVYANFKRPFLGKVANGNFNGRTGRGRSGNGSACKIGLLMPGFPQPSDDQNQTDASGQTMSYRQEPDVLYTQSVLLNVNSGIQDGIDGYIESSENKSANVQTCDLDIEWQPSGWCDEKLALGQAVSLHTNHNVKIIVGPPCHKAFRVVGLLGSYWSTPVVTWEPVLREVIGEKSYNGVMSVYGSFEDMAQSALALMKEWKWTKIAILIEDNHLCGPLIEELGKQMLERNFVSEAAKVMVRSWNTSAVGEQLKRISKLTRTIVTCTRQEILQEIVAKAEELGLTDGYYAFLHLNFDSQPQNTNVSVTDSDKFGRSPWDVVLQLGQFHPVAKVDSGGETLAEMYSAMSGSGNTALDKARLEGVWDAQTMLLPYLHDAIVVAAALTLNDSSRRPAIFDIDTPYTLHTGDIHFDTQGIRKAIFSLVQRQEDGEFATVARIPSNQSIQWINDLDWVGGDIPRSELTCRGNDASCTDMAGIIAGSIMGVFIFLFLVALAFYFYRKYLRRLAAAQKEWVVDDRDVKRRRAKVPLSSGFGGGGSGPSNMETVKRLVRMETRGTLGLGSNCSLDKNMLYAPIGNYKDMVVAVKHVRWTNSHIGKREMLADLTTAKELSHDNVNQFVGAYVSPVPGNSYVLFRYCSKGSLQDVLNNEDIKLDWMFKLSFALDLARGIEYIHKTALRSHGNLKSSNCVIDSRWVLKLTDFGAITSFRKPEAEDDPDNQIYYSSLLWTAPELLRMTKRPHKGTQRGDIYSFGIILQEILFRCAPYFYNYMLSEDIVTLVKRDNPHRPFRPVIPPENELHPKAINLMTACWAEAPETRPDCYQIRKRMREFNGAKRFNIMDNMLQMLEAYSTNLEQLVTERTEELEAEKRKTDTLLYQMLPPLVAEQLKSGMSVIPESYDNVSIFFSDIVGFTTIASYSKPLEVVDLLNDLYTCFDEVIARRDVYKVETIGDAYMCVSGCPKRNGNRHAGEIANMALELISAVSNFRIRHIPEERLNLRVGLHTGACAAGVVGRTMPRYCLFGDTVNMASRMESTGKALHIHMSYQMKDALDELDWGFIMVERGFIEVKGKGLQKTFWLAGKRNYNKTLPESMLVLQKSLDEGRPSPAQSFTTLTVGDSMFSALRKTSLTISNITVRNTPCQSDTEDMHTAPTSPVPYGNLLDANPRHKESRTHNGSHERRSADDGLNDENGRFEGEPAAWTRGNSSIELEDDEVGKKKRIINQSSGDDEVGGDGRVVRSSLGADSSYPHRTNYNISSDAKSDNELRKLDKTLDCSRGITVQSDLQDGFINEDVPVLEPKEVRKAGARHGDMKTVDSKYKKDDGKGSPASSKKKRKRAVTKAPAFVVIEPDLIAPSNEGNSEKSGSKLSSPAHDSKNGADNEESLEKQVKESVKKDSACYSMTESEGGETTPSKKASSGNSEHSRNREMCSVQSQYHDCHSGNPPILQVSPYQPAAPPTDHKLKEWEFGRIVDKYPPKSGYEEKPFYTTGNKIHDERRKDLSNIFFTENKGLSQSHGAQHAKVPVHMSSNHVAPLITVQHEDGSRPSVISSEDRPEKGSFSSQAIPNGKDHQHLGGLQSNIKSNNNNIHGSPHSALITVHNGEAHAFQSCNNGHGFTDIDIVKTPTPKRPNGTEKTVTIGMNDQDSDELESSLSNNSTRVKYSTRRSLTKNGDLPRIEIT